MTENSLTFRTAKKHIEDYNRESDELMAAHREASDGQECEAFLDLGIEAHGWLIRAIRVLRTAEIRASNEVGVELEKLVDSLRATWLRPCEFAEKWVGSLRERGFQLRNLEAFRGCCENIRRAIDEEARLIQMSGRLPSAADLALIAIPPPREWTDEPSWTR